MGLERLKAGRFCVPIQSAPAGGKDVATLFETHGAGKEATTRIGFGVIEASIDPIFFNFANNFDQLAFGRDAVPFDEKKLGTGAKYELFIVALNWDDETNYGDIVCGESCRWVKAFFEERCLREMNLPILQL